MREGHFRRGGGASQFDESKNRTSPDYYIFITDYLRPIEREPIVILLMQRVICKS